MRYYETATDFADSICLLQLAQNYQRKSAVVQRSLPSCNIDTHSHSALFLSLELLKKNCEQARQ